MYPVAERPLKIFQKSVLLAQGTAAQGFSVPAGKTATICEGRSGESNSGLRFLIRRLGGNDIRLIGQDEKGKDLVAVRIEMDGGIAGAVLFKGQDSSGRVYVEVERLKGARTELEVHRYTVGGERLAVISMPNNYFTTVYKKTEVTPDGSVYQMLTTPEGVQIHRY